MWGSGDPAGMRAKILSRSRLFYPLRLHRPSEFIKISSFHEIEFRIMILPASDTQSLLHQSRRMMERIFGFQEFRPGQEPILEAVFLGKDALVVMPTGGGKSLCYQLPALVLPGVCLVISPLIALMKDQVDSLRVRDVPVISIHSLMGITEQEQALSKISAGTHKLIYVSPERLRSGQFLGALKKQRLSLVAVDEAHCISEWGHDFRPDYLRIGKTLESLGRPQTIALTATATERVREDIIQNLKLRLPHRFVTGFDRKNLHFEVLATQGAKQKLDLIEKRIKGLAHGGAIVYTGTRKAVEAIVEHLNKRGIPCEGYHGGMEETERSRVQEDFLEGRANVIAATNAFGMGIDRPDIRIVIHHQIPGTVEAYYQECGRAGRDGDPSLCLLLFSAADRRLQEFFIESNYPPREVVYEIYGLLLGRSEDPIWLTYREIGEQCRTRIPEMAVASSLKILEEAGVICRLHRHENLAELYLKVSIDSFFRSPLKSGAKTQFLKVLRNHYSDEELTEGIQFVPDDILARAKISKEAFRRIVIDLEEKREAAYIPPFRGRGLRLLSHAPPQELTVDFQKLTLRKAHEMDQLNRIMAYGQVNRCRRAFLLEYFGEYHAPENCKTCDNCKQQGENASSMGEGMDPLLAVKILSGVARLKGRFGRGMAVKTLTGSKDEAIERFRLHRLSTYGLLAEFTQNQVEKWIEELMGHGCLKHELAALGEKNYRVLLLTDRGKEIMQKRENLRLSIPPAKRIEEKAVEEKITGELEKALFEELRKLRLRIARREALPPYCIFHDRTLREMARRIPKNPSEMMRVVGVGEITFRKYGRSFLDVIASFISNQKPCSL